MLSLAMHTPAEPDLPLNQLNIILLMCLFNYQTGINIFYNCFEDKAAETSAASATPSLCWAR